MDVGLLQGGLDGGGDGVWVQDADGDVLGDDLFVLPAQGRLEVGSVVVIVVEAKGVVVGGPRGRVGVCVGGPGGGGCDCHGEDGDALLLGEAQGGGDAVLGGLEGAVEGLEGELEIDCVAGLGGLDGAVFKEEVHWQC